MYKKTKSYRTTLEVDNTVEGKSMVEKVEGMINNKEPLTDGAPIIHQERKDGVRPEYNIRADRFEIAVEANDAIVKAELAKRESRHKTEKKEHVDAENPEHKGKGHQEPKSGQEGEIKD